MKLYLNLYVHYSFNLLFLSKFSEGTDKIMNASDCPALAIFITKNAENDTKDKPEDQIVYPTQNTIENEVSHPLWDQTEGQKENYASNLNVDYIEYQLPNQINPDAFDPNWDQTENQVKYERSADQNGQDGPIVCLEDKTNNETYFSKLNDIRPANIYGRFPCNYCPLTFKTKIIVRMHEKKSCKGSYQNDEILSNENGKFLCKNCNTEFGSKGTLKRHQQRSCDIQKEKKLNSKKVTCESCNITFKSNWHLKRHVEKSCKAGKLDQKKIFHCSYCNETFTFNVRIMSF